MEHYTAWLTTDPTCLDQKHADVLVLRDEANEAGTLVSTGDPLMHAVTTVDAKTGDIDDAIHQAEELLEADGWQRTEQWQPVPTGAIAAVTRV